MFYYILMLKISNIFIKEKINLIKNKYKDYKKYFIHLIQLYLEENLK